MCRDSLTSKRMNSQTWCCSMRFSSWSSFWGPVLGYQIHQGTKRVAWTPKDFEKGTKMIMYWLNHGWTRVSIGTCYGLRISFQFPCWTNYTVTYLSLVQIKGLSITIFLTLPFNTLHFMVPIARPWTLISHTSVMNQCISLIWSEFFTFQPAWTFQDPLLISIGLQQSCKCQGWASRRFWRNGCLT